MSFDPNIFLGVRSADQEVLSQLYEQLEEFHQNPEFVFILFQSLESDSCRDSYVLQQVLIQIKLSITKGFDISPDFWNDEQIQQIINNLFSLVGQINEQYLPLITYSFEDLAGKLMHEEWFWHKLIEALETFQDINKSSHIVTIISFWLNALAQTFTEYNEAMDAASYEVIQRLVANIGNLLPLIESNSQAAEYLGLIVKCVTYQFQFSFLTIQNSVLDSVFEAVLPVLGVANSNKGITFLKGRILKLIKISFQKFLSKPTERTIKSTDQWKAYSEHFKNDICGTLVEQSLAQMSVEAQQIPNQTYTMQATLSYILYLILFYHLNDSIINQDLFPIMIQLCVLSQFNDLTDNPMSYIGQNMRLRINVKKEEKANPRLSMAESLTLVLRAHTSEEVLPHLLPDLNQDSPEIIDSKLYLITAMARTLLEKQNEVYETMKKKAKKQKVKIPPFRPQMPLPEDIVTICTTIIETDGIPPFLLIRALHLLSYLMHFVDANQGLALALTVIGSDIASEMPIVVVYASKLFCKCFKKAADTSELEYTEILQPVINAASEIKTSSLNSMVTTIAQKSPEAMASFAADVCELLVSTIHELGTMDPSEIEQEQVDQIDKAMDTLFQILDPNSKNTELLGGIYENVFTPLVEVLANATTSISTDKLFLVFGLFSMNFQNHPEEFYASFAQINDVITNEEDLFRNIVNFSMQQFVWYLYPLIAEKDSPFIQDDSFKQAVLNIAQQAIAVISQQRQADDTDFEQETVPYTLFLCATIVQSYGAVPEFLDFAVNELLHAISLHQENPNLFAIEPMLVIGFLYVVYPSAAQDGELLSLILQQEQIVGFLLENLTYKSLTSYHEMKIGELFLLMLVRNGIQPAFEVAVRNLPKLLELKQIETTKNFAQPQHTEEEEALELPENPEDDGDEKAEEDGEEDEQDLDDETVAVIIHPYLLQMETVADEHNEFRALVQEDQSLIASLPDEEMQQYLVNYIK